MCELLEFKITNFPFFFLKNYIFRSVVMVVFKGLFT